MHGIPWTGVGAGVGTGVGDGVGAGVGDGVGAGVGDGVGAGVGDGVGEGVGVVTLLPSHESLAKHAEHEVRFVLVPPDVYEPAVQTLQLAAPAALNLVSLPHDLHDTCASSSWKLPAAQSWHAAAPSEGLNFPATQLLQTTVAVWAVCSKNFPAGQGEPLQLDCPFSSCHLPTGHASQECGDSCPGLKGLNLPGAQAAPSQLVCFTPCCHWPAVHGVHLGLAAFVAKCPAAQFVHGVVPLMIEAPASLVVPAGHCARGER